MACTSLNQCTAVDQSGEEVTFNPDNAGTPTPSTIATLNALSAVTCPSASQCTAVDSDGQER